MSQWPFAKLKTAKTCMFIPYMYIYGYFISGKEAKVGFTLFDLVLTPSLTPQDLKEHPSCKEKKEEKKTIHLLDCLKLFTDVEQLGEEDAWYDLM